MSRLFLFCASLFLFTLPAFASWYYNGDGGIGAYQPDGWTVIHNGRSSKLTSPGGHGPQSSIFFGSDWVDHIDSQDALKAYVEKEEGPATAAHISDLDGFRTGTTAKGAIFLLRENENVIVIRYEIRGDDDQKEEAQTVLDSVEVRTDANTYP